MQGFLVGEVCFAEKATNSRSLLSDFSFHDSSSINHSRWASISKQACWNKHSKYFHIVIIIFHLLLYVAKVLNSLIDREWRPIRIEFLTLQGKPNTHAWGAKSPTQHFPFLSGSWIRATPLDYRVRLLCTHMLRAWERCAIFKKGESKVHS